MSYGNVIRINVQMTQMDNNLAAAELTFTPEQSPIAQAQIFANLLVGLVQGQPAEVQMAAMDVLRAGLVEGQA